MKMILFAATISAVAVACSSNPTTEIESTTASNLTVGATFNLGTLAHPGSCMDAAGAGTANGTQIQEVGCNGNSAQSYRIQDAGNSTYTLVNTNANKCVDVNAAGTANGTKVQLWDCNGTGAQAFYITDMGNGFVSFVNLHSNKCLDVAGGNPADGTLVQLWDCNGTNAQKWNPAQLSGGGTSTGGGGGGGGTTGSGNMTVVNRCNQTVWAGVLSNSGDPLPAGGGFKLDAGQSSSFATQFVNGAWGGRVWGRTGCDGSGANCATGNCGTGACNGAGGVPPVSLAEFTIVPNGTTFYDVSLVDGYNLEMQISAAGCPTVGCTSDLNAICPAALQQRDGSGKVVACRSDCEQYNTDAYCCRGSVGPTQCQANPPPDAHIFKQACPQAYSYAYDDLTSTFTCNNQANYTITFCP